MINDLITTNNLDFMFLIETWLEDNCSATVLTETAPPNFNFISVYRTVRRGGGVAALFKDVYQCKQVSFGQYLSFEYLVCIFCTVCIFCFLFFSLCIGNHFIYSICIVKADSRLVCV